MITVLLCIIFGSLTFDGLTLSSLMTWFNAHPFLFIIALYEFIHGFFRISLAWK